MRGALLMLTLVLIACDQPPGPTTRCGNGVVEAGEACDDGNHDDDDDCLDTCELAFCGDGDVDEQGPVVEACDTRGVDTAECDRDCTRPGCGDGHVNAAAGEVCDDGNAADGDGCSGRCDSDETCGNSIVDTGLPNNRTNAPSLCLDAQAVGTNCAEVCDDGNTVSGDGCSANCLSEEVCGNRIRDAGNPGGSPPTVPELCDDGNQHHFDECPNDCVSDPGCGDGLVDPLVEQCDSGQPGVNTASCDANCTLPVCGDGTWNTAAGEQCDPAAGAMDRPTCDRDCTLPVCGDLLVNTAAGEQCEPPDAGSCSAACQLE